MSCKDKRIKELEIELKKCREDYILEKEKNHNDSIKSIALAKSMASIDYNEAVAQSRLRWELDYYKKIAANCTPSVREVHTTCGEPPLRGFTILICTAMVCATIWYVF